MANHKSAEKRIRGNDAKRTRNKYYAKTARTAIKALSTETDKTKAAAALPKVVAMLDKLAKKSVIHKNKAANLKSKLAKRLNAMAATTAAPAAKATKTKTAAKKTAKKK